MSFQVRPGILGWISCQVVSYEKNAVTLSPASLSKEYLRSEIGPEGIYRSGGVYVRLPEWNTEQRVEVLRGVEATALVSKAKTVRLADGRTFGFQILLLATGGRPRHQNVLLEEKSRVKKTDKEYKCARENLSHPLMVG